MKRYTQIKETLDCIMKCEFVSLLLILCAIAADFVEKSHFYANVVSLTRPQRTQKSFHL